MDAAERGSGRRPPSASARSTPGTEIGLTARVPTRRGPNLYARCERGPVSSTMTGRVRGAAACRRFVAALGGAAGVPPRSPSGWYAHTGMAGPGSSDVEGYGVPVWRTSNGHVSPGQGYAPVDPAPSVCLQGPPLTGRNILWRRSSSYKYVVPSGRGCASRVSVARQSAPARCTDTGRIP